jgi:hypothetical protein
VKSAVSPMLVSITETKDFMDFIVAVENDTILFDDGSEKNESRNSRREIAEIDLVTHA